MCSRLKRIQWLYTVLLLTIALLVGIVLRARADATCNRWQRLTFYETYPGETTGAAVCYLVQLPAYASSLNIQLKVLSGNYDLYWAKGANVQQVHNEHKLNNFFVFGPSSSEQPLQPLLDSSANGQVYTLVVAPVTNGVAVQRFQLTLNDRDPDPWPQEKDSAKVGTGDLGMIPAARYGVALKPGARAIFPFAATCLGAIKVEADWSGKLDSAQIILYNPAGTLVARKNGKAKDKPAQIQYSLTATDTKHGERWSVAVINKSREKVVAAVIIDHPDATCPIQATGALKAPRADTNNSHADASGASALKVLHFQNGQFPTVQYEGATDASLFQVDPNRPAGNDLVCLADGDDPPGTHQALATVLRWDISLIPAGSVVRSATITLNVTDRTDQRYPLYPLLRPWVEHQVTWFASSSTASWGGVGASASTDRAAKALGILMAPDMGKVAIPLNADGVAVVQAWVNNPATNYGLLITNPEVTDGVDFECSESTNSANRPRLTVQFSNP